MDKKEEQALLKQIKKHNGEQFANSVRAYGVLEIPGIADLLAYAGRDAGPLKHYLLSLKNIRIKNSNSTQDVFTLCRQAGYRAYVVTALTDDNNPNFDPNNPETWVGQNTIERYFASQQELQEMGVKTGEYGEKLCTFRDPTRYLNFFILNIVHDRADKLNRADFIGIENREDEYSHSVSSIQIAKKGHFISIKSRYNHTVSNPDNTFFSNPDEIIPGLSEALRQLFNVDFSSHAQSLPENFICAYDQNGEERIVHYHTEVDGVYFGDACYVTDGKVYPIDKDKEVILEHVLLNFEDIPTFHTAGTLNPFADILEQQINDKIQITKDKNGHHLWADGQEIVRFRNSRVIGLYHLPPISKIDFKTFADFYFLEEITLPDELQEIGVEAFYACKALKSITLPKRLARIESAAFWGCTSLKEITLPNGVQNIKTGAFESCFSLEKATLPENLKTIEFRAFNCCSALKEIDLPSTLISIEPHAFANCSSLKQMTFPPNLNVIECSTCLHCYGLETVTLPKNLTSIEISAFEKCTSLKNITFPEGLTEIQDNAFWGCESLTEISLPDSVKFIGDVAFAFCSSLKKIKLPSNLKTISDSTFVDCSSLSEIILPKKLEVIEENAFVNCFSLKTLTLPKSVKKIGKNAFQLCDNLVITCATKKQVRLLRHSQFTGKIVIEGESTPVKPKIIARQLPFIPFIKKIFLAHQNHT